MGFLNRKKNPDARSSALSESEIQKKLYGEFSDGTTHVVTGERDALREPEPFLAPPEGPATAKETARDLFDAQGDVLIDPDPPPHRIIPQSKSVDLGPRYIPLQDFEKKTVVPQDPSSSGAVSHGRFFLQPPSKSRREAFWDLGRDFSEKGAELVRLLLDPKQVALRRTLYWLLAVLAVFLLFWGVNALNSQREEAMRTRYKISGETVAVKPPASLGVGVPSELTEDRSVVATPAPVTAPKAGSPESGRATGIAAGGKYVIQVVTYPTRKDADQVVKVFTGAGLQAFVKEDARPSGRVFYLVLIGGFRTAAEAHEQLSKFRAQEVARPFQDAFVKTNRS